MSHGTETDRLHRDLVRAGVDIEDIPAFDEVELTEQALTSEELTWDDFRPLVAKGPVCVAWFGDAFAIKCNDFSISRLMMDSFETDSFDELFETSFYEASFLFRCIVQASFAVVSDSDDADVSDSDDADDRDVRLSIYSRTLEGIGPAAEFLAFLVRLFVRDARCSNISLEGSVFTNRQPLPLSDAALELAIQTNLPRKLHFSSFSFNEHQCFLLARFPNENVNISFCDCSFEDEGSALADAIDDNQGICKLSFAAIHGIGEENIDRIFNGLRRNTRVNELRLQWGFLHGFREAERRIFVPLAENRGLELLSISFRLAAEKVPLLCSVLEENRWLKKLALTEAHYLEAEHWSLVGHSIKNHPTIEEIYVTSGVRMGDAKKTARDRAFSGVLETNTVLLRIVFNGIAGESTIYRTEIWPRLVMNRFRPLFAVIKQEHNETWRAKLFGWTLGIIKSNPNFASCQSALLKRLVSDNPDLVMKYYVQGDLGQSEQAGSKQKRE